MDQLTVSQTVELHANIFGSSSNTSGSSGQVEGVSDVISFIVDPSSIEFGNLAPSEAAHSMVTVTNTGSRTILVEVFVSGDPLFTDHLVLNTNPWQLFNTEVSKDSISEVEVSVTVPSTTTINGDQIGSIIFWAIAQ